MPRALNVFPILPGTKRPAIADWQARAAPVATWPPGDRWAAPTGPGNDFWVLDVDPRHGGLDSLRQLERHFVAGVGLQNYTRWVTTPSGGLHIYWAWSPEMAGVKNTAGRLGPGLDIRTEGGYVLCPPTEGYVAGTTLVPQRAPKWLLNLLAETSARRPFLKTGPFSDSETIRNPFEYARSAMAMAVDEIRNAPGGSSNDTLNRNAYNIGRLLEPCGLDRDKTAEELVNAAIDRGVPAREALEVVNRAIDDGANNPREVGGGGVPEGLLSPPTSLLLPPNKTRNPAGYWAWMDRLRRACDVKLVVIQYDQSRVLYERVEERLVSLLGATHVQAAAIKRVGEAEGLDVPTGVAMAYAQDYLSLAHAHQKPPTLYDVGHGYHLWKQPVPLPGPTPAWDTVLTRMSDPELFLAHVWSAFEPKFTGRQVLWLQGEGNDGKTILFKALFAGTLGERALGVINDDDMKRSSQFAFSSVWDRPATLINDTKLPNLMMYGSLHRLTGRDLIGVEYKFGSKFNASYQGVLWVSANTLPNIEGNRSNLTRLSVVTIAAGGWVENLPEALAGEMLPLLYRAREAYAKLCPKHFEIELSETARAQVEEATDHETDAYLAALKSGGFSFDKDGLTPRSEFVRLLNMRDAELKSFYHWLRRQPGVSESKITGVRGFRGVKG